MTEPETVETVVISPPSPPSPAKSNEEEEERKDPGITITTLTIPESPSTTTTISNGRPKVALPLDDKEHPTSVWMGKSINDDDGDRKADVDTLDAPKEPPAQEQDVEETAKTKKVESNDDRIGEATTAGEGDDREHQVDNDHNSGAGKPQVDSSSIEAAEVAGASNNDDTNLKPQPLVGYWLWKNTVLTHKMRMHLAKNSDLALHVVLAVLVNQVRYERNAVALTV